MLMDEGFILDIHYTAGCTFNLAWHSCPSRSVSAITARVRSKKDKESLAPSDSSEGYSICVYLILYCAVLPSKH